MLVVELCPEDCRSQMKIQYNCAAVVDVDDVVAAVLDVAVVEPMSLYLLLYSEAAVEVDDQAHYFANRLVMHLQMEIITSLIFCCRHLLLLLLLNVYK